MATTPTNDFMTTNGTLRIDGRVLRDVYLLEVKKPEELKYPWDYVRVVGKVPRNKAFRPLLKEAALSSNRSVGESDDLSRLIVMRVPNAHNASDTATIMLDHLGSGISRDQTCKSGIEWDTCVKPHYVSYLTVTGMSCHVGGDQRVRL